MSPSLRKLVFALLLLAALYWIYQCVQNHLQPIQADVGQRSQQTLSQYLADHGLENSHTSTSISSAIDGRTVTVTGTAPDQATRDSIIASMKAVYGVARVIDKIEVPVKTADDIATEATKPEPAPVMAEPVANQRCEDTLAAVLTNEQILFDSAAATIKTSSKATLLALVDTLQACPDVSLQVAGHSDSSGNAAKNLRLSEQRAAAVVEYLENLGVRQDLTAKGFGETEPLVSNDTPAGRAKNRRIEFTIIDK